ncbi:MAG: exonuclease domain-containing protein, partial [Bacteroidota bacterium]
MPVYSIIDIETTGGDPKRDRITEIAILKFDGEQ